MYGETVHDKLIECGHGLTNHLVGQICTLLDSTLTDERQAKAAKDIAMGIIWQGQHERMRGEEEILLYYRKNPKSGLIPEWLEAQEKARGN